MTPTGQSIETTPIEECMAKRGAYRDATKTVEQLIDSLGKIYAELAAQRGRGGMRPWQTITIAPGGPYPSELAGGPTILADRWPTAQQFNSALSQWHSACFEYRQAWTRVPDNQKRQYPELRPDFLD